MPLDFDDPEAEIEDVGSDRPQDELEDYYIMDEDSYEKVEDAE